MCFPDSLRRIAVSLTIIMLVACGGAGNAVIPPVVIGSSIPGNNVLAIMSDAGPAGAAYQVNRLYTDITICQPGTSPSICETIDHVLVDTGSSGLRLLASEVPGRLGLNKLTGSTGFALLNCAQFVDTSFAWGPVAVADITLGNMTASSVPIQIVADPGYQSAVPAACSAGGVAITSVIGTGSGALGAKGILGIGQLQQDCGPACVSAGRGYYYTCTNTGCTTAISSATPLDMQLTNPVTKFATDYNGLVVYLPTVPATGAVSVSGSIVFGVGSQANNVTTGTTLLKNSKANPYITAVLNTFGLTGLTKAQSFLDTGSNGLFFDAPLATCPNSASSSSHFYCPPSTTTVAAMLTGSNNVAASGAFAVSSPTFASGTYVMPQLAGPMNESSTFDGGLPFFFGRRIFIGIEGMPSPLGTGPFYAF